MQHILIIEDNHDVNALLCQSLEQEGYDVDSAYDGISGLEQLKAKAYDLLLLDIMLPYKSGDTLLKELRSFSTLPVIVLSAKDMVGTKIDMLKLGADDYLTKPFDLGEVAARVESLLRRVYKQQPASQPLTYKDMVLYPDDKRILVNSSELDVTQKEYQLLELFLSHPKKVFSKANLYESIWEEEYLGDDNTIKAHLSNLRTKLKKVNPTEDYIETVWGLGYRLRKDNLTDS